MLAAADSLGEAIVCLLGEPSFYARFGFVAGDVLGVESPVLSWGRHFQARALTDFDEARHAGRFAYAAPFGAL